MRGDGRTMGFDKQPWIDLWDAALYVVSAGDNSDRLVGLMPPKQHPVIADQFPEAKRALNSACLLLAGILRTGRIKGIGRGARDADRALRPIVDLEWQTRFIHFSKSELHPPIGAEPGDLPAILGVMVKRADVERECAAAHSEAVATMDTQIASGDKPELPASAQAELSARIRRRATKLEAIVNFFKVRFPAGRPSMTKKELANLLKVEAPEIGRASAKTIERALAILNSAAAPISAK